MKYDGVTRGVCDRDKWEGNSDENEENLECFKGREKKCRV